MKNYDFKKTASMLLKQAVTDEEAKFLKTKFGLSRRKTDKGVLLLASLFELAVSKGSAPAAKEFFSLSGEEKAEKDNALERLIAVMQEV